MWDLVISQHPTSHPDFSIHRDLIFHKSKIWFPFNARFISLLLEEFHTNLLGGHMGMAKTLHRLHQNFDWPQMHSDVYRYVSQCMVFQQIKYKIKKPTGLLQPLPTPSSIWEDLPIDFIIGLPQSNGFTTILVVVDKFSKEAYFRALPTQYTACKTTILFLDMVCKLHGFPCSLVSYRDP